MCLETGSYIVAGMFISAGTCLPSRCLAMHFCGVMSQNTERLELGSPILMIPELLVHNSTYFQNFRLLLKLLKRVYRQALVDFEQNWLKLVGMLYVSVILCASNLLFVPSPQFVYEFYVLVTTYFVIYDHREGKYLHSLSTFLLFSLSFTNDNVRKDPKHFVK
jgi:hypothetical protein